MRYVNLCITDNFWKMKDANYCIIDRMVKMS